MKYPTIISTAVFALAISGSAMADLTESMDELCGKMKTCSLAEIKKQGLPEEMQAMIIGMFDGMCQTVIQPYAQSIGQAGLEDKAEACVDSIVSQNCESIMSQKGSFTSEKCQEFEKAADAAGLDLGK